MHFNQKTARQQLSSVINKNGWTRVLDGIQMLCGVCTKAIKIYVLVDNLHGFIHTQVATENIVLPATRASSYHLQCNVLLTSHDSAGQRDCKARSARASPPFSREKFLNLSWLHSGLTYCDTTLPRIWHIIKKNSVRAFRKVNGTSFFCSHPLITADAHATATA